MDSMLEIKEVKLDEEWLALILKAKKMGFTTGEIRKFFAETQPENTEKEA